MYLISISIVAITYLVLKWRSFYKKPKEWEHIPSVSIWSELYRLFTDPQPIDVAFEKYTLPILDDLGLATFCDLAKGYTLFVTNPESLKEVFKNTDIFVKEPFADKNQTLFIEHFGEQQVVNANGEDWKRYRKIMNPIFNQSWKPELFGECFNQVIEEWDKLEGKDILIHDQIQRMTLDVMGKAFFDFDFESVKNPESKIYKLYHDITNGIFSNFLYLVLPILDHIPYLKRYDLHAKVAEYNKFVDNLIESRKKQILDGRAHKDNLLTQFVQASMPTNEKDAVMTDRELRDNLKVFFVAGHDTTANTITSIIYYLSRYPEVQDKLRSEIIEVMGESNSVRVPTVDELKQMNYLNMVIKESTRCMSAAPATQRRATKPFTLSNGAEIPEGRTVTLHMWGLFHNPKYFPEPNKFDPERFRDPNCEANKSWIPFITGARTCIGMSFSLMEQRVTLAMLLQTYTFKISPEHPDYERLRLPVMGFPRPTDFKLDLVRRISN